MKRSFILLLLILTVVTYTCGQPPSISLTFSAIDSTYWVQLDSIKVMNRTQGGDTVLYYPDTVLVLDFAVGIPEAKNDNRGFQVDQNYPNPTIGNTNIKLYVPEKDKVSIIICDILGRVILQTEELLDKGIHSFRFKTGDRNIYFFTARWKGRTSSIKILNLSSGTSSAGLDYLGAENSLTAYKLIEDVRDFLFSPGDELLYIGYVDNLQSGISDTPDTSKTYTFQFATNMPCLGTPIVEYEGQVYNTIQILSQCWIKQNLNVGTIIQGNEEMSDNAIIEKYCYNNKSDSCAKYGGLYQWDEMMQYETQQGVQGVCPQGWHLPNDEEWKVLEGAADTQYGIGAPEWDVYFELRGFDAGENMKTISGWNANGNGTDLFGFSGLPGGFRGWYGSFYDTGDYGYWWSSNEIYYNRAWYHALSYQDPEVYRDFMNKELGFSVRCLRDEIHIPLIWLTFTASNNTTHIQLDSIKIMNKTRGNELTLYGLDTTLILPIELRFRPGDELLYVGYADSLESGIIDSPDTSQTYTFQFATNIPCPGLPTITYEGQVYNTIQVFSQCWLKEDLNVGTLTPGTEDMTDNGIIEKYCFNDNSDSCAKYGAMYQWQELMQYTSQQGIQGICPPGWHVPSDEEWKILEGAVDSQHEIGSQEWDIYNDERGYDAGTNLKTTDGWYEEGSGTDLYNFSARPAGFRHGIYGYFAGTSRYADWWTSTRNPDEENWVVHLSYNNDGVSHIDYPDQWGFHVRCLKDD